jgi:AcrR family transcriptional regulator
VFSCAFSDAREVSKRAPRRTPTQERSRDTVDAILEATDRNLRAGGLAGLTMRGVANVSGVSMGTLYQYFATRDALLAAWEEGALTRVAQKLSARVQRLVALGAMLEVSIYALATWAIDILEHHFSAYPRDDGDAFFSRALERQNRLERAAEIVVAGLGLAGDQSRIRPVDRLVAARVGVRCITNFARDLVGSALDADVQAAMRREAAIMMVHLFVLAPDESLLGDPRLLEDCGE